RSEEAIPEFRVHAEENVLTLELPARWLESHPLTRVDLEQERDYHKQIGIKLVVSKSAPQASAA
ncbi:MAG: hypothetical protein WBB61_12665, partial [Dokdonella sp.]